MNGHELSIYSINTSTTADHRAGYHGYAPSALYGLKHRAYQKRYLVMVLGLQLLFSPSEAHTFHAIWTKVQAITSKYMKVETFPQRQRKKGSARLRPLPNQAKHIAHPGSSLPQESSAGGHPRAALDN
jgi:hypothetical protein